MSVAAVESKQQKSDQSDAAAAAANRSEVKVTGGGERASGGSAISDATPPSRKLSVRKVPESELRDGKKALPVVPKLSLNDFAGNKAATDGAVQHPGLYDDPEDERPELHQFLDVQTHAQLNRPSSLAHHPGGGAEPEDETPLDPNGDVETARTARTARPGDQPRANLGTILGVYLPCLQNIFGVILFIRLVWIVGTAGFVESFAIVFLSCITTLTTAISMSAIATNGRVPGGGSYFMISRNLGPEFGGAVGFLFYLATSVAASMYILGAAEIFLLYLVPGGDASVSPWTNLANPDEKFANFRIYGLGLLIFLFFCVFLGMRFVTIFASIALACVLTSITLIYVGIFITAVSPPDVTICFNSVGDLMRSDYAQPKGFQAPPFLLPSKERPQTNATMAPLSPPWDDSDAIDKLLVHNGEYDSYCTMCPAGALFSQYCNLDIPSKVYDALKAAGHSNCTYKDISKLSAICDVDFASNKGPFTRPGIPGLSSGIIRENLKSLYASEMNHMQVTNKSRTHGDPQKTVVTDSITSFFILLSIFFPSCTGIMAGSNRSGDLRDASRSIPIGTIAAIVSTSFSYLSAVFFFAACIDPALLRDKEGRSIGGGFVVAKLAWPHPLVVTVGSFLSTCGAGLQSLTGAPRLLQAIAKDEVIPIFHPFAKQVRGEPLPAQLLTASIVMVGVIIANIDSINGLITEFFLMCYTFVNLACALQSILKTPNWRPRFKFYHWSLSTFGVLLCVSVMFMTSWYFALAAIGIAGVFYKYIEFKGAEKEWGDGVNGLQRAAARYALLKLEDAIAHPKNWRPHLLVFLPQKGGELQKTRTLDFTKQLKSGKGLVIVGTFITGQLDDINLGTAARLKEDLKEQVRKYDLKAIAEVMVAGSAQTGYSDMIQLAGIGGLRTNTVLASWPEDWSESSATGRDTIDTFLAMVSMCRLTQRALMVLKPASAFPKHVDRRRGTIDVWWIVHDGGLLLLIPYLLTRHKTWAHCKLRIFTVAHRKTNSVALLESLRQFVYELRINAEIDVIEMDTGDISAYAVERTMMAREGIAQRIMRGSYFMVGFDYHKIAFVGASFFDLRLPLLRCAMEIGEFEGEVGRLQHIPTFAVNPSSASMISETSITNTELNQFTFTPSMLNTVLKDLPQDPQTMRLAKKMHSAESLNKVIRSRSSEADLIIINLPKPSTNRYYMYYIEMLTRDLSPVLLVRGTGYEVVTTNV